MLRWSPARVSWVGGGGGGGGTPPAPSDPCGEGDGERGYTPGTPAAGDPPRCPPAPLPVSAWQQDAPPFRSPPGFSGPPPGARHHWHRFRSRQQLQGTGEGMVRGCGGLDTPPPPPRLASCPKSAKPKPPARYLLYKHAHADEQHRGHHRNHHQGGDRLLLLVSGHHGQQVGVLAPRPHVPRMAPAPVGGTHTHGKGISISPRTGAAARSPAKPGATPVFWGIPPGETKDPLGFELPEVFVWFFFSFSFFPGTYTHAGLSSWTRNRQVPWKQNWL